MSHPLKTDSEGNIIIAINPIYFLKIVVIVGLAISVGYLHIPGLTPASRFCLMLFVGAAGLWVSEVIPPFATAILVVVLSVYVLGFSDSMVDLGQHGYRMFLNPFASPALVLFFGGFILAAAATKHGMDVRLAKAFIKPFGTHPHNVLLAIILATGVFSMFMSNTATTAMMIAIMAPIFNKLDGRDLFKKAIVLAIPFAANIGGIATIIGTPPNAVAASVVASMGQPVSFLQWMVFGVPLAIILLFVLWYMLKTVLKPNIARFEMHFGEQLDVTWDLVVVIVTFVVTVLLWITEPLHHLPSGVVALLPIMVFTMFGILDAKDLKTLDWDVLILVAGGLVLGEAMQATGLSNILAQQLAIIPIPSFALLFVVVLFSIILSNFMSHTSASNVIIPIVVALGVIDPKVAAVGVAISCSLAMSLPISTPPNAMAFATHAIETREMAKYGTLMSLIGVVFVVLLLLILRMVWH